MGKPPVLKPREVVAILEKLGFVEEVHTNNIVIQTVVVLPFHSTQVETYRQFPYVR